MLNKDFGLTCGTCDDHAHAAHEDEKQAQEHERLVRFIRGAASGNIAEVLAGLRQSIPADRRPRGEETALTQAIRGGHEHCAWALLGAGADPNKLATAGARQGPMHAAAAHGALTLLKALVAVGGDPDCCLEETDEEDNEGLEHETPLACAVQSAQVNAAQLLRSHGAATPWHLLLEYALTPPQRPALDWLLENRPADDFVPWKVLATALRTSSTSTVTRLLDAPIADGGDIVHAAVERGEVDILRRLLDHGVDVNRSWLPYGLTPLELTPNGLNLKPELVNVLELAGANVKTCSDQKSKDSARTPKAEHRTTRYYKGFEIIAAFYKGEYQARGHHRLARKLEARKCAGIDDAVRRMQRLVDAELKINFDRIREGIIETHKAFIHSVGKKYLGATGATSLSRVNHCYKCKRTVDSAYDLECKGCSWIICSNCGACGCGYGGL